MNFPDSYDEFNTENVDHYESVMAVEDSDARKHNSFQDVWVKDEIKIEDNELMDDFHVMLTKVAGVKNESVGIVGVNDEEIKNEDNESVHQDFPSNVGSGSGNCVETEPSHNPNHNYHSENNSLASDFREEKRLKSEYDNTCNDKSLNAIVQEYQLENVYGANAQGEQLEKIRVYDYKYKRQNGKELLNFNKLTVPNEYNQVAYLYSNDYQNVNSSLVLDQTEQKYICPLCKIEKAFSSLVAVDNHLKSVHSHRVIYSFHSDGAGRTDCEFKTKVLYKGRTSEINPLNALGQESNEMENAPVFNNTQTDEKLMAVRVQLSGDDSKSNNALPSAGPRLKPLCFSNSEKANFSLRFTKKQKTYTCTLCKTKTFKSLIAFHKHVVKFAHYCTEHDSVYIHTDDITEYMCTLCKALKIFNSLNAVNNHLKFEHFCNEHNLFHNCTGVITEQSQTGRSSENIPLNALVQEANHIEIGNEQLRTLCAQGFDNYSKNNKSLMQNGDNQMKPLYYRFHQKPKYDSSGQRQRKTYVCPLCGTNDFKSLTEIKYHLRVTHYS